MSFLSIPGGPPVGSSRRAFVRNAAAVGLALPTLGAFGIAGTTAQDQSAAPDGHAMAAAPVTDPRALAAAQDVAFTLYDPALPAVQAGTKDITVVAKDATVLIAKNVAYAGWTFDGTIPGRAFRVVEGDTVNFTLKIDPEAITGHSMDFHSAKTAPDVSYRTIAPGEELTFSFVAKHPGAYMYHCGTPPVLMHIGAGMYGAMIVDPKEGWPPAREFVFVQSDFYVKDGENGVKVPDMTKMMGNSVMDSASMSKLAAILAGGAADPNLVMESMVVAGGIDHVAFNGYANQYVENPISVAVGEPIRIFVVNAGPNIWSSFHVVGTVFDRVCVNAHPKNELFGMQSISIGPGDGACVEFTLDEPGTYPVVNHAFGHATHGAVALLKAE